MTIHKGAVNNDVLKNYGVSSDSKETKESLSSLK